MSARFHLYLCGRIAAEWLIDMIKKEVIFVCDKIQTPKGYSFWLLEDAIIGFKKRCDLAYMEKDPVVLAIAKHTMNTWQKNRPYGEILQDTLQGKIAEQMLEDLIAHQSQEIQYLSYDSFREDNCQKHAPFDGLLFQKGNPYLSQGKAKILSDVARHINGGIFDSTRSWLSDRKLYTVEVKSSRVPDRSYPENFSAGGNRLDAHRKLLAKLRERDIFCYPKYTRDLGQVIHDFSGYLTYVEQAHPELRVPGKSFREVLLEKEAACKSHIHLRIFVDKKNEKNFTAYLPGYALREDFFREPTVINMARKDKSENALYYVYPFAQAQPVQNLWHDNRLW